MILRGCSSITEDCVSIFAPLTFIDSLYIRRIGAQVAARARSEGGLEDTLPAFSILKGENGGGAAEENIEQG